MNSILLHLEGPQRSRNVISLGVELARRAEARVRDVAMIDTRRIQALTVECETAAYVVAEQGRLQTAKKQRESTRAELAHACLDAGLNFDVRLFSGDPLGLLESEAQFHDLVITAFPAHRSSEDERLGQNLAADELIAALQRGVQPLLVVRRTEEPISRTLLVYDGTAAASRTIRSYLASNLFPEADHRLLVVGNDAGQAQELMREMAQCCRSYRVDVETGWLVGSMRRVLLPYAEKWSAELIVLGMQRGNPMLRRLFGDTARRVLLRSPCALFACC